MPLIATCVQRRSKCRTLALQHGCHISVSVEQMILHDSRFTDELLQEHLAEAAGMRDRKTDVLI